MSPKRFLNDLSTASERLRREFDDGFAEPAETEPRGIKRLLHIALGPHEMVVTVDDLASLHELDEVVPLPTSRTELLGLVTIGGRVYPCFSLAALLDLELGEPSWLLLSRAAPVALAVDRVLGQFLVDTDSVHTSKGSEKSPYIGRVRHDEKELPLLDPGAILDHLRRLTGEGGD